MIRFLNNGLGGTHRVTKDKVRQIRVVQRYRTQEQRFVLWPNPEGHPAIIFDGSSRHDSSYSTLYTFKRYTWIDLVYPD
jgi:hypothetical protein